MKKYFLSFGLLLIVGLAAVVFNSCGDDKDDPKTEVTDPNNPNEPTDPDEPDDPDDPTNPDNPDIIAVTSISLNSTALLLLGTEYYFVVATVLPENATDKTITWVSSNTSIATVTAEGEIRTVDSASGEAIVTATAGNQSATVKVWVNAVPNPAEGVVINGVRWATRNVDAAGTFATTPTDYGQFYQWNRKVAWTATDVFVTGWDSSTIPGGAIWERDNDPSPAGWRVPTKAEFQSLLQVPNYVTKINGVAGSIFGTVPNIIFLPAAGYRSGADGTLFYQATEGDYWSNTQNDASRAYCLGFGAFDLTDIYTSNRRSGFSIRSVSE